MPKISEAKLKAFFGLFSTARVQLPKADGNLYEVFVYLETCIAAKREGFGVNLIPSSGHFIFRASPGNLGGGYGYAELTSPRGKSYELHNGIEVVGHSRMQHEADILLLSKSSNPVSACTSPTPLALTIECKNYSSAKRLKSEVRKAAGMVTDWAQSSHASSSGLDRGCLECGKNFEAIFSTSVRQGLRKDIEDFLKAYEIKPCFGVLPGATGTGSLLSTLSRVFNKL